MKSMRDAIKDAGIKPEDIDYVNVHGTSTPAGDIPELKAVAGVLGDHVYNINISSTKSMTDTCWVPPEPPRRWPASSHYARQWFPRPSTARISIRRSTRT